MNEKKEFRRRACRQRGEIRHRKEKSEEIARSLFQTEAYRQAGTLFVYLSFQTEADTAPVLRQALADKKRVAVPRVTGVEMVFCQIDSVDCCRPGAYGILEPDERCPVVQADQNTLILVPGCAFTRDGKRMGYGGGYYDRYLAAHPQAMTAGYAFEEQLYEELPWEVHDRLLDRIITQKGCYER